MRSNLLTASRLKTLRRCRREHHIKYELGYRPIHDAEELFFGVLVHLALEAWWIAIKNGQGTVALELALARLRDATCDAFDRARAEAMMTGYHEFWLEEAALYEVLGVELRFRTDVVNPQSDAKSRTWLLGGKLDVLVRERATGRVLFIEHKTSAEDVSLGSPYWRKLRIDGQVSIYFDGSTSLGHEVAACLYDVLSKPGMRPLKATPLEKRKYRKDDGELYAGQRETDETPDEYRARCIEAIAENPSRYYSRGEVVRLEGELDESRADIWDTAKGLREEQLAERAPRNPDACQRNGGMCSFFDVCTGGASLDDPGLFIRDPEVHPELAGDSQPNSSKEEHACQPQP